MYFLPSPRICSSSRLKEWLHELLHHHSSFSRSCLLVVCSLASTYLEDCISASVAILNRRNWSQIRKPSQLRWSNFQLAGCPLVATSFTATVGHIFPTTDMTLKPEDERLKCCGDNARLAFDNLDSNLQSTHFRIAGSGTLLRKNLLLAISNSSQIRGLQQAHLAQVRHLIVLTQNLTWHSCTNRFQSRQKYSNNGAYRGGCSSTNEYRRRRGQSLILLVVDKVLVGDWISSRLLCVKSQLWFIYVQKCLEWCEIHLLELMSKES